MSQANVEATHESVEAWNRGDLERLLVLVSPDWEWHSARLFPGTDAVYRGREGLTRFWNNFREPWQSISIETERIEDLGGDRVLCLMTFYGKGKGSGVDVTQRYANVLTFRDGLVTYQVGYGDWESALKAAGLAG